METRYKFDNMSLKDDLKRIFFGAKAVAKSAADKASDAARETGGELKEKGEELFDQAKDNLSTWLAEDTDTVSSDTQDFTTPTEPIDFEEDVVTDPPKPPKEPSQLKETANELLDKAAKTGAQALDKAGDLGEKVMQSSEKVGEQVFDIGGKILDKAKELGGDLMDRASDAVDRAQDAVDRESLQDATAKAEALAKEAKLRADNALKNTKDTLLDGKDDFFARAERFAEGDYHNEGGKDVSLGQDPTHEPKPKTGSVTGLEDGDGDGDPLIDDAIIDES